MRLHVLGSGSCIFNQKDRLPASYILETDQHNILIDTGTGITQNIPESEIAVEDIDVVINTHRHPDHVSDLIPFIQNKVVESIYYSRNEGDLSIYGPEGHGRYVKNRIESEMDDSLEGINKNFPFNLEVRDLTEEISLADLNIGFCETEHGSDDFPCLAIKIETESQKVVFTGDTDYFESLIDFSKGADMVVADCSMPDEKKVEGHMTPSECFELAESSNTETLVLSHLYPEAEDISVKNVDSFSGNVVKAKDLIDISI